MGPLGKITERVEKLINERNGLFNLIPSIMKRFEANEITPVEFVNEISMNQQKIDKLEVRIRRLSLKSIELAGV